jgi:hypothetical protein
MDGAITELGYGRSGELKSEAERAGKRWALLLADDLHIQSLVTERRWRGLPIRCSAWPEHLWGCWCDSTESYGYSEPEVLTMREPFIAEAAMRLDVAGYDCR